MEAEFCPVVVIERLCAHHKMDAKQLLLGLIEGLGQYHCYGQGAFPEHARGDGTAPPNVACEIETYLMHLDAERHQGRKLPASLLEAVMLCLDFQWQYNHERAHELQDDACSNDEFCDGLMAVQRAQEQKVMVLALKECINQAEAVGLEMAIEDEAA